MGKWFSQFEALIWFCAIVLGMFAFAAQVIATKEYVDVRHESVMDVLNEIREDVREIRKFQKGE